MQPITTRTRRSSDLGGFILGQRIRTLLGSLYLGRTRRSQKPGFVLQPTPRAPAWLPRKDWRVSVTSSAADACVSVEVESYPVDCSPEVAGRELVAMLANAKEAAAVALARGRVGVTMRHLTGSRAERVRAVRAWRMRRATRWARRTLPRVGAVAAVLLALVGLVTLVPRLRPVAAPPLAQDGTGGSGPSGALVLASTDSYGSRIAAAVPERPFPGQKVRGCDPDEGEVFIPSPKPTKDNPGACWVGPLGKAPCPKMYESGGKCYRPAGKPHLPQNSIHR